MRKGYKLIALGFILVGGITFCMAGTRDSLTTGKPEVYYKFYPLNAFGGQLPQYCADFKFGTELIYRAHHGFEIQAGFSVPNPLTALFTKLRSGKDNDPYWLFGGRGSLSYRYYFLPTAKKGPGVFLGVYVSVSGLQSLWRHEGKDNVAGLHTTSSYSHFVMSNYAAILGYHYTHNGLTIEISGHFGYRYDYFWRSYRIPQQLDIEYDAVNNPLYHYLKTVPVGGGINLSVGGVFRQKKK